MAVIKNEVAPRAKLPRKLKKDIIKTCGREAYRDMVASMQKYYNCYGYIKFKIRKQD